MKFEFSIEKMTRSEAAKLLNIIIEIVELLGLHMAGGFSEEDDGEQES